MALRISKVVDDTAMRPVAPAHLSEPLLAVLGEIRTLRADHGTNAMFSEDLDALEDSVRRVLRHVATTAIAKQHRPFLSLREVHVLRHVAAGMPNRQIALRLGISEKTVRNHMTRIFVKLGASNRTEAVVSAMRTGVLSAGSVAR